MYTASLVNAAALVGISAAELAAFGGKTAGVVSLLEAQAGSPVAYSVPKAWAIPAGQHARVSDPNLHRAFDDLVAGADFKSVLMARSSATDELPGENPTLSVAVDNRDLDGSFSRFRRAAHEVGETKGTMGVLMMPMQGQPTSFSDGTQAWGWGNVSFVGDTHYALNPQESYVAFASGLGTRVVEAGGDFIPVTVNRETGLITSFGSKSKGFLRSDLASRQLPDGPADYRQVRADFFDLQTGKIATRELGRDHEIFRPETRSRLNLLNGRLVGGSLSSSSINGGYGEWLQFTPFGLSETLTNLIGAMTYLTGRLGRPLQIEGAFPDFLGTSPVLYQLLELPALTQENRAITLDPVHLRSTQAIGIADFTGPLIYFPDTDVLPPEEVLKKIDRTFSDTGYILLMGNHDRTTVLLTPHCRLRLSVDRENIASHAVTLSRFHMSREPDAGYVMAMQVEGVSVSKDWVLAGVPANRRIGPFLVFENSRLQADGREVVVQLRADRTSAHAQGPGFLASLRGAWGNAVKRFSPSPSPVLYDPDRPLLDQVAPEQRGFMALIGEKDLEEEAIPLIRDRKKVEIDPRKNPRDYTLAEWIEMIISSHEEHFQAALDRGRREIYFYDRVAISLNIFLQTSRRNAEYLQTHPLDESAALRRFPTLELFSSGSRANNFILYFDRRMRNYNLHPIMIRFRRDHPTLYARLADSIQQDRYGPGSLPDSVRKYHYGPGNFPDELFKPLYEAYRYIAENYTALYDIQEPAALTA